MREDRRVRRTRRALVEAFNHLVLEGRQRHIRVPDIVKQAGVGRSTFYEHFGSAEALHLEALRRPLGPVADAAAGIGDEESLLRILAHFWEYRHRARRSFGNNTERLLASMVEDRLSDAILIVPRTIAARQLAAAALAPIQAWVAGEAPSTPAALVLAICRAGRAQREALRFY